LPQATRAVKRDELDVRAAHELCDPLQLPFAADQRRGLDREIGRSVLERAERRERRLEARALQLVEPLGRREVAQAVLAEVARLVCLREVARRLREEDLAAVGGSADPRGAVDVEADIAGAALPRLPRVDAHADTDAIEVGEGALCFGRGVERVVRARKGDQGPVALDVHLDAVVGGERLAEAPVVLLEERSVRVAALLQQPHPPFDVGEEERDCAGRKLRHGATLACYSPTASATASSYANRP
jgi:hypothetical protein